MKRKLLSLFLAAVMMLGTVIMSIPVSAELNFNDVDGHWATEAIEYVVEEGLMNGVGNGESFAPNMSLTRGMVVTVLYRNERANQYEYYQHITTQFNGFADVTEGAYYYDAVMWAGKHEIVNGTGFDEWGEPCFSPDRAITRQELATMFLRYAKYKYVTNNDKADLTKFPDVSSVASWATDAVAWAVYEGLITGKSNGGQTTLSPTDTATRAEFATIIKRYNNAEFDYEGVFNMPIPLQSFTEPEFPIRDDADIFVALDGSDSNPGTKDKPLATFEAAAKKVRELKKTAKDEIVVAFKAGNYGAFTYDFTEADSGSEKITVTYCAYGDGEVIFDAGVQVSLDEFEPITKEEEYLFPASSLAKIKKADLSSKKYAGELGMYSYLYNDEEMLSQACFPNKKSDGNPNLALNVVAAEPESSATDYHVQFTPYIAARFDKYHTYENILFTGVFGNEYYGNYMPLKEYDPETDYFTLYERTYCGMYICAQMIFHNISEELDNKDEYWVDIDNEILYVYEPSYNYTLATAGCFVNIEENANYLNFIGFSFKHINNDYAFFIKGDHINIDACHFFGIGDEFAIYSYGQHLHVTRCEFEQMVGGGIIVRNSGDNNMLVPGGLVVDNNSFHDFGKYYLSYKPAVLLQEAVGARVSHNEIYNAPHSAIIFGNGEEQLRFGYEDYINESGRMGPGDVWWNEYYYIDNVVEYNFIHDLFDSVIGDAGAIYMPRSATDRGNQINSNIIANVLNARAWAIYLDDGMSGVTVKNNIMYNPGVYGICGGGSNYYISGNMIIDTDPPATGEYTRFDKKVVAIGPNYANQLAEGELNRSPTWPVFFKSFNKIPTDPEANALWRERWPELFLVADNLSVSVERLTDPYSPTNNFGCTIINNCAFTELEEEDSNYYNDSVRFGCGDPDTLWGEKYMSYHYEWNTIKDNKILDLEYANEYFVNVADGDYTTIDPSIGDNGFAKIGRY